MKVQFPEICRENIKMRKFYSLRKDFVGILQKVSEGLTKSLSYAILILVVSVSLVFTYVLVGERAANNRVALQS